MPHAICDAICHMPYAMWHMWHVARCDMRLHGHDTPGSGVVFRSGPWGG
jgi:hypothetical protein